MAGKPKAKIVVQAFAICCPKCGEPQAAPCGSELWTEEDLAKSRLSCALPAGKR